MDFRQIEAFVAVVQTNGFSSAAEQLHISQPSVSAYIAALERELGHPLINRSTKTLIVNKLKNQSAFLLVR